MPKQLQRTRQDSEQDHVYSLQDERTGLFCYNPCNSNPSGRPVIQRPQPSPTHEVTFACKEEDAPSGTIPYMAPEFLENKNVRFTEKTEVFSLGVLLWEIFSDPRRAKLGPYPNM